MIAALQKYRGNTTVTTALAAPPVALSRRQEWSGILACIGLYFALRLWGLQEQSVPPLFDEGVHLGLMKMLAEGGGALYRDLLFIHPPGVVMAGAWLWPRVQGNPFALRLIYIVFCGLGFIPMAVLTRRLYGNRVMLITLFLLAVTPGFADWLGSSIFLELPLNVLLYTSLWLLTSARFQTLAALPAGLLLGLGFLIKETAVPMALAIGIALWAQGGSRKTLLLFGFAFTTTFALLFAHLAQIPNYLRDTFTLNAGEPYSLGIRPYELLNGFYQLPLQMTFGALGVFWMIRYSRNRAERFLGIFALVMAVLMFFLPKRFYWRYLIPVMPICSLGVAVWWERFRAIPRSRTVQRSALALGTICGLLHVTILILYHTREAPNPPAYRQAVRILRAGPGPLFTLDPIWAVVSGQALPNWPYACDAVFARQYHLAPPAAFTAVLQRCPVAVLDHKTIDLIPPETEILLRKRYHTIYCYGKPKDRYYVEILRRTVTGP
jgi:hypothetical protein